MLYIQSLNGIIGIISKKLLLINIVEVIDREYLRIQVELNSFSSKTVNETVTVNKYVRYKNCGCCLYILAET